MAEEDLKLNIIKKIKHEQENMLDLSWYHYLFGGN